MIERFFNLEALGKNSDYKDLAYAMAETEDQLMNMLDQEQKPLLLALTDLYAQLESCTARASFQDGFCTAALLALDIAKARDR